MRIAALVTCVSLAFLGCPTPKTCDATTCATGCCDATGTCQLGDAASACGTAGALCLSCAPGFCSTQHVCSVTPSGGGAGTTGGGAGATGGGTATGGGAGGGDAGTGRTVVFTNIWRLLGEDGGVTEVNSLGDTSVALYLANGSTLTELPGTRSADRYTVPNVPPGPWVVRYGNSFFVVSTDTFNRGGNDLGRTDTTYLDAGAANLTLAVSGLPAWSSFDDLLFFSVGANFYGYGSYGLLSGPAEGQIPSSFNFDYASIYGSQGPVVSAAKGDTLYVAHMKNTFIAEDAQPGAMEDGGTFYLPFTCLVSSAGARLTTLEVTPGPNSTSAAFTVASPVATPLKISRSLFAAREPELHPTAVEIFEEHYVFAEPLPDSASPDLVYCLQYPDTGYPLTDIDAQVNVLSPVPAAWPRRAYAVVTYRGSNTIPDAGTWSTRGFVRTLAAVGTPVAPGVHSPINVTVQGVSAAALTTVSASSPLTVSWNPSPNAPAATDFEVELVRLTHDGSTTTRTTVASATTRGTSFTFPVGFLTANTVYFVRVNARVSSSPENAPNSMALDSLASALTNAFLATP